MQRIDTAVTHGIWDGQLPVRISIDPTDAKTLASGAILHSHYTFMHRCSYLPLVTESVREVFVKSGVAFTGHDADIWYEYRGVPLKWHYPIGLLHDLLTSQYRGSSPLPWHIIIHFTNFPTDKLIRINAANIIDTPHDSFMSMIKEADYIRNGSIKKLMSLSKQDQTNLWQGLSSHDYDKFWNVNARLVTNDNTIPKYIPLRVYLLDQPVIQEPVAPVDDNLDCEYTLRDILGRMLPEIFPPSLDAPTTEGADNTRKSDASEAVAILHGIVIPIETPILWLSQNCSYPDNFLHIVICR
ncbi:uncharacterized protein SPPG_08673 [Spizellomyces punctatus DAOM BR117]|uniref:Autophagy protein 5 n=2 Tax=Spizellomyces punctatus (strain DAOM BR117) TaxID=645134 RepID=A0A0L0H4S6_SPIPD|nr:uncharacterized protein SPPG_08673 [Spizellomyces punctatus DAOM BR117]KNC95916.1 hypothetical protein SPPG_08673 [Spizellomyces punctatus DAOM BR117]|eukprot:XP_016603956.1 hypothetical protein SPPG_08673 [Spizellomyces punctatus DAOM BR117]